MGISDPIFVTGGNLMKSRSEALVQWVKTTYIFSEVEPQQ